LQRLQRSGTDKNEPEKVFLDKDFEMDHPKMNAIVYSQLAVAAVDGTAHHCFPQGNDGTNKNRSDGKGNKKGKKKITFGLDEEIDME
jgi:hypothetical protein